MGAMMGGPLGDESDLLSLSDFQARVESSVVPLRVEAVHPAGFSGELRVGDGGDIHLFDVRGSAHSVHRGQEMISDADPQMLKFSLMLSGTGVVIQDGHRAPLGPGALVLYDTARPYSVSLDENARMGAVLFPKRLALPPAGATDFLVARNFAMPAGVVSVVNDILRGIIVSLGSVEGAAVRRLAHSAVDVISMLLEEDLRAQPRPRSRALLVEKCSFYIDEHLSDPDLSPRMIASAHYVSVRHLHAVFAESGTSVSSMIRERRLDRAYEMVTSPIFADRTIGEVAAEVGFANATHFGRAFHARFGVSPSAVRRMYSV